MCKPHCPRVQINRPLGQTASPFRGKPIAPAGNGVFAFRAQVSSTNSMNIFSVRQSVDQAGRRKMMVGAVGGTVIVVEDDNSMREAIKRLLNAAGLRARHTRRGSRS